jgi:hypothetical protein
MIPSIQHPERCAAKGLRSFRSLATKVAFKFAIQFPFSLCNDHTRGRQIRTTRQKMPQAIRAMTLLKAPCRASQH